VTLSNEDADDYVNTSPRRRRRPADVAVGGYPAQVEAFDRILEAIGLRSR
jgi:hypothetical protein